MSFGINITTLLYNISSVWLPVVTAPVADGVEVGTPVGSVVFWASG